MIAKKSEMGPSQKLLDIWYPMHEFNAFDVEYLASETLNFNKSLDFLCHRAMWHRPVYFNAGHLAMGLWNQQHLSTFRAKTTAICVYYFTQNQCNF